jgi:hypothetical protein
VRVPKPMPVRDNRPDARRRSGSSPQRWRRIAAPVGVTPVETGGPDGGHRQLGVIEFEVDDQSAEDLAMGLDRVVVSRKHAATAASIASARASARTPVIIRPFLPNCRGAFPPCRSTGIRCG